MSVLSPYDTFENLLRRWWLIVLLAISGGGLGWLYHQVRPPIYAASAVFYVSIDFTQTGELTQFEEDHAVSAAAAVILSNPVIDQVVLEAGARGFDIDGPTLFSKARMERKQARWILSIRDSDPQVAATLANLWAEHGLRALQEAHSHALQAQRLRLYVTVLDRCLAPTPPADGLETDCVRLNLTDIQGEARKNTTQLEQELAASQGLLPALVFDLSERASPPKEPLRYGQNTLVLAGGVIGFLVGIWAINLHIPLPFDQVSRRD